MYIPSVTYNEYLFYNCGALKQIGKIHITTGDSTVALRRMFASDYPDFTDFGGFIGIAYSFYLTNCTALTRKSLLNVLNGLSEISTSQTANLGDVNLTKLTEEDKAIATEKGWLLR